MWGRKEKGGRRGGRREGGTCTQDNEKGDGGGERKKKERGAVAESYTDQENSNNVNQVIKGDIQVIKGTFKRDQGSIFHHKHLEAREK